MKRQTDKSLDRIERKRKKLKAFLDIIEGKTGVEENISKLPKKDHSSCLKELRDLKKEAQKIWRNTPYFKLLENGIKSRYSECEEPLSQYDVQCLLLSTLIPKHHQPYQPFYELQRVHTASKVAIFILDGVDVEFANDKSEFFTEVLKYEAEDDWVTKLLYVPLTTRRMLLTKDSKIEPTLEKKFTNTEPKDLTPVSKMDLLLSLKQLYAEGYPLPDGTNNYKTLKESYTPVTNDSPMFGLDCEMCISSEGKSVVTHMALVNEKLETLLYTYVKPDKPIKDYLTRWSGVKKEHLDDCRVSLEWVQDQLGKMIPSNAILVGQSLHFDLKALGLMHPYVIDTSVIYSFEGVRTKPSLKTLSMVYFDEEIQKIQGGHCPNEDAIASLKLAQLKLSKGLEFGDRRFGLKSGAANYLPLISYADLFDVKVNVFYDYLELENESKFVCVMSSFHEKLMSQIMKAISTDKCICMVITKDLCCLRI